MVAEHSLCSSWGEMQSRPVGWRRGSSCHFGQDITLDAARAAFLR
ncbi:hypothetical protein PMI09_01714, partial [Rhizobium sp. CF122]